MMVYNRCGNSGLKELCFTAFDHGITHFDLANNYGPAPVFPRKNWQKLTEFPNLAGIGSE